MAHYRSFMAFAYFDVSWCF